MKKLLTILLSILCVICMSIGMVGCGNSDEKPTPTPTPTPTPPAHTHIEQSSDFDATHHWKKCECGEPYDKAEHDWDGGTTYCSTCKVFVVYDAESFQEAIDNTMTFGTKMAFANDVDLSNFNYEPPYIGDGDERVVEIDGRGFGIIGQTKPIYEQTYNMTFNVKNLYFINANVQYTEGDFSNQLGLFSSEYLRTGIACTYNFTNCHIVNATIKSANYCAGFIGYSNGGNINVTNCSFSGSIEAPGSVGIVVGHTIGNVTVNGLELKANSTVKCSEDRGTSARKAGLVFGTVAFESTVTTNFKPTIVISNAVNNGTVVNINGVANADNSDLYGRNAAGENATVTIVA